MEDIAKDNENKKNNKIKRINFYHKLIPSTISTMLY